MKKIIYFVRHGESEGNIATVHQGLTEPLSPKGIEQGKFIAERVSKLHLDAFIASPIVRTRQTAEIIAKKIGKEPEYVDLFVESRGPSSLWGVPRDSREAIEKFGQIRSHYGVPGWRLEDAENYEDHCTRARAALEYLAAREEAAILVVTHGLFLRIMLAVILFDMQPTPKEIQQFIMHTETQNTGVTVCEYDLKTKQWLLWVYNDHAHLD